MCIVDYFDNHATHTHMTNSSQNDACELALFKIHHYIPESLSQQASSVLPCRFSTPLMSETKDTKTQEQQVSVWVHNDTIHMYLRL